MPAVFDKCSDALEYAVKNKSFAVFYSRENTPNFNIHTHECCEIFLCLKGGNTFLIDGKVYDIKSGDLFFMNQFEPHKVTFLPGEAVERYVLHIHPDFIYSASTDLTELSKCFYSSGFNKISLESMELGIFKEYFKKLDTDYEFADDVIKNSVVVQILAYVNILANRVPPDASPSKPLSDRSLRLALSYIDEHFCEDIRLETVAKSSYISVTKLCSLFKSNLGTTASKYITGKRISEAKKLLKKGYSVSDTAMMCGFGDYSNFIRTFSSNVGISPGKYSKSKE